LTFDMNATFVIEQVSVCNSDNSHNRLEDDHIQIFLIKRAITSQDIHENGTNILYIDRKSRRKQHMSGYVVLANPHYLRFTDPAFSQQQIQRGIYRLQWW